MTKTLTEQWREGTLDGGYYYLKMKDGNVFIDHTEYIFWSHEIRWETKDSSYIKEVLSPVPNYEEYKELVRKSDKLDKIMSDSATNQGDCQQIVEDNLNRQIERLQKKLNEANTILKSYANRDNWSSIMDGCGYSDNALYVDDHGYSSAENYLKKWGVK